MKAAHPRHSGVFAIPSTFGKFNAIVTQDSRAMIGTVKATRDPILTGPMATPSYRHKSRCLTAPPFAPTQAALTPRPTFRLAPKSPTGC